MIDWDEIRAMYNRIYGTNFLEIKDMIAHAYDCRSIPEAAKLLGVGQTTLQNKLKQLGLQRGRKLSGKVRKAEAYLRKHGTGETIKAIAAKLGMSETPVCTAIKRLQDGPETVFDPWPGVMRWHNWKFKTSYATIEEMLADLYAKLGNHAEMAHRLQQNKITVAKKLNEIGLT